MKSYLFKQIANKFISLKALPSIYDDSTAVDEKVRSTDLNFNASECLELQDDEQIIVIQKTQDIINAYNLPNLKQLRVEALNTDFNKSKKITIQNGKTLIIAHDTPERDYFLKLIENVSNVSKTPGALSYEQEAETGGLGFRILPEIATYIFKDLFMVTLPNGTQVNARSENKYFIYKNALEQINKATTQTELDDVAWSFLNPQGVVIDVNTEAAEMLADPTVSDVAKAAINATKDPATGEIHLVKTLPELAAHS